MFFLKEMVYIENTNALEHLQSWCPCSVVPSLLYLWSKKLNDTDSEELYYSHFLLNYHYLDGNQTSENTPLYSRVPYQIVSSSALSTPGNHNKYNLLNCVSI